MSLTPPEKLQKLQAALHAKAKASPSQRFHALYDKVYRWDVLIFAYARCKANGGAPGVDGRTFKHIEESGLYPWLSELAKELKDQTYRPSPVRRVWIRKPDGKKRPLGIPTIKDRVAQTAAIAGARTHLRGRSATRTVRLPGPTGAPWMRSTRCVSCSSAATRKWWTRT